MAQPMDTAAGVPIRGLHGQLVEELGQEIAGGQRLAGEQIMPEELVERFGVSRTVVREALRVLETKGLITARPKTGTKIRASTRWHVLDPDVIRWRAIGSDAQRQFEELVELRGAIEQLAARKAARGDFDDRGMAEALHHMSIAVEAQDWDAFTEADVEFHRQLLEGTGSLTIRWLATPIETAIRVRHGLSLVPETIGVQVLDTHAALVDAIRSGDAAQAELASVRIVDVAGAETLDSLIARNQRTESALEA